MTWICHFHFFAMPRASCGYICCGFIPSTVWRFSNTKFPALLHRCRLGTWMVIWHVCTSVTVSLHLYVCTYVCASICLSTGTFVWPYVPPYVFWDIWGFIRMLVTHPGICLSSYFFIMSQSTTVTTTTPHVTHVYCSTSSLTVTVTMCPTLLGIPATSVQHDVFLPQLLMLRDTRGVVGLTSVPQ